MNWLAKIVSNFRDKYFDKTASMAMSYLKATGLHITWTLPVGISSPTSVLVKFSSRAKLNPNWVKGTFFPQTIALIPATALGVFILEGLDKDLNVVVFDTIASAGAGTDGNEWLDADISFVYESGIKHVSRTVSGVEILNP